VRILVSGAVRLLDVADLAKDDLEQRRGRGTAFEGHITDHRGMEDHVVREQLDRASVISLRERFRVAASSGR
jgi:hypothetical protein